MVFGLVVMGWITLPNFPVDEDIKSFLAFATTSLPLLHSCMLANIACFSAIDSLTTTFCSVVQSSLKVHLVFCYLSSSYFGISVMFPVWHHDVGWWQREWKWWLMSNGNATSVNLFTLYVYINYRLLEIWYE